VLRRILLIAKRDYLQTVTSKGFLIGLIVFPLLFGGAFLVIALTSRGDAGKTQRIAIIDRTGVSAAAVIEAAQASNGGTTANPNARFQAVPRFTFEEVKPDPDQTAQLLSLSDQIRNRQLFMVVDIAPDALRPSADPQRGAVRYYTNSAGFDQTSSWLTAVVNDALRRVRLSHLGVDEARIADVMRDVPIVSMNLMKRDPVTGKALPAEKKGAIPPGVIPYFLSILLIMVMMFGAAPNLGVIAEDKMQRVFEMLLGSATPFELMAGKVLASLGMSLTSSVFYIAGGLLVLAGLAMFQLAPLDLLPWFFAYLIANVVMLSAWAAALGSASATPQDAQHMAFLLILPIMIPMFVLAPIIQQPHGVLAVVMSFIPPFTPVVMLLRQALPGGVPWWQPWVGLVGVIVCALLVLWGASRIFRVGILSQGKTPKLPELIQWVFEK
jgi:ABC-2 type transport system permease protein